MAPNKFCANVKDGTTGSLWLHAFEFFETKISEDFVSQECSRAQYESKRDEDEKGEI